MGKINDLSPLDKPREKAGRFGIENLSDKDLLALIINSGTVGHSALDIAGDIMHSARYLSELLYQPHQYFQSFKGVKTAIALRLAATMEIAKRINQKQRLIYECDIEVTSEVLFHRYQVTLGRLKQETMAVVILNNRKQIIYEKLLYQGNANTLAVDHKEVLRLLVLYNGAYFYILHNHPNGTLTPSKADVMFTTILKNKAKQIGIKLIDHLIITQNGFYSFAAGEAFIDTHHLDINDENS